MSTHSDQYDVVPSSQTLRNLRRAVILLSLLIILFGLTLSWVTWRAEYARQTAQLGAIVTMSEQALNAYLGGIAKALTILGEDILGADGDIDTKAADFQLKRFKKVYPELRIVIVARTDGQILSTSESRLGDALPTLAKEPSFIRSREELQRGDRLSIGRAFLGPVSGEWIIPVRYGLRDREGVLRFMLGVGLPVSKTYSFWKDAPLPPDAALGLVRDDLYVVSRYPVASDADLKALFGQARTSEVAQHLAKAQFPKSGIAEGVSSLTSTNTVFIYRRLADYPVTLYVINPKINIWAAWWRDLRVSLILMGLLIFAALPIYRWMKKHQQAWEAERDTRLQLAIDAAGVGIWLRDLNSNMMQWSAELKRLLGYAPDELKESREEWLDRIHPDDREAIARRFRDAQSGVVSRIDTEVRLRHRDGSYRTFLSRAALVRGPSGDSRQLLGAVVDITDRKAAEEQIRGFNAELEQRVTARTSELQRAHDELIRSEKLAALGGMVAGIAHDLNTPIGNAVMASSALSDHVRDFIKSMSSGELRRSALDRFLDQARQAGEILEHNLHQAAELISSFKRVSTDQLSEQRRRFFLDEVVAEVLISMSPMLKHSNCHVDSAIPKGIEMDSYPGPLGQVLMNLIQNATVHAFEGRAEGRISIVASRAGSNFVEIAVSDDGIGVPPEDQKRIFDPFFTTKLGRGGSGLGLTIVNNIVTGLLDGRISMESTAGKGTTFRVVLPLEAR